MAQLDTRGFFPDTTPNPALGEIAKSLQENARYKQQLAIREQDKKEQRNQQNRMFNLREINDLTDFDKYKTNQQALDAYSHKALGDIANKALTDYVNLDPAEMEFRLKNDMKDYISWHSAVSGKMDELNKSLPDFNKTYSNIDYEQAKRFANTNLISDFIDPKTGERKIPNNLDRNYVSELQNPDVLAQMVNDTTPTETYYNSGLKPFHSSDFTSIAGVKNRNKFSGYYDPGKNFVTADASGNPTLEVNFETVPGVNKGEEPLKIIDQNQYEHIINDPKLYPSFLKLWNNDPSKEGRMALEQHYENTTGKPMDDNSREIAFRHWLYLDAKKNLPSYINQDKAEIIPKTTNITNISVGGETNINDIYSRIKEATDNAFENPKAAAWTRGEKLQRAAPVQDLALDESNLIVDFVNKSYPNKGAGDNPYKASELFTLKGDDGKVHIYDTQENDLGILPQKGTNLKAQPGIKEKRKVLETKETKAEDLRKKYNY